MEIEAPRPDVADQPGGYMRRRLRQGLRLVRRSLGLEIGAHAAAAERAALAAARSADAAQAAAAAIQQALTTQRAAAAERAAVREAEALRRAAAQAAAEAERTAAAERAAAAAAEAAAARLAAILSDEDDEPAALVTVEAGLEQIAARLEALGGEVSLRRDKLRPLRRADLDEKSFSEMQDIRGLFVGEGVALSRGSTIERSGGSNLVVLAPGVRLSRTTVIVRGTGNIVYFGVDCRLSSTALKVIGDDNLIAIGRGVTVESASLLCERSGRSLVLGDDCMVSNGVVVRTSDHHGIFDRDSGERLNAPADVIIGAHVWLGNGCRVNKGTRVGRGTVIGQGSIASGELGENCIYAGVPARQLRAGIVWSRTNDLAAVADRFR